MATPLRTSRRGATALGAAGSAFVVLSICTLTACSSPLKPTEIVRDAIADGERSPMVALPACDQMGKGTDEACLVALSTALGSKTGFNTKPPDQAAAGAVAVRIARDSRGASVNDSPTWLAAMAGASGPGPDALRLAVASTLAKNAADFAPNVEGDGAARKLLGVVGGAVPGACQLYTVLGSGVNAEALPLSEQPAHSPCLQLDLTRSTGPGGAYGFGTFRAAEGALALARDTVRALKEGAGKADAKVRSALEKHISTVDAAVSACALHKVLTPGAGAQGESATAHAMDGGATPLGSPASTTGGAH